jgi:hypothetical protein
MRHDALMDQRWVELARTLRELGMWENFSEEDAVVGEREVAAGSYPFGGKATLDEEPGLRYFFLDADTMAEGRVKQALADFEPALHTHGVDLQVEDVSLPVGINDGDYIVAINDRRCVVWTPSDWTAQRALVMATVRPLALINDLLSEAGAAPRLFTLYAGSNDGFVWLLDPRIVAAVADSGLVEPDEIPALAAHD